MFLFLTYCVLLLFYTSVFTAVTWELPSQDHESNLFSSISPSIQPSISWRCVLGRPQGFPLFETPPVGGVLIPFLNSVHLQGAVTLLRAPSRCQSSASVAEQSDLASTTSLFWSQPNFRAVTEEHWLQLLFPPTGLYNSWLLTLILPSLEKNTQRHSSPPPVLAHCTVWMRISAVWPLAVRILQLVHNHWQHVQKTVITEADNPHGNSYTVIKTKIK